MMTKQKQDREKRENTDGFKPRVPVTELQVASVVPIDLC